MRTALASAIAAGALSGCKGKGDAKAQPEVVPVAHAALVMPSDAIRAYEWSTDSPHATLRWEFYRNDARLGQLHEGPLLATNQWPNRPRPIEVPIRFYRWKQN